MADCRLMCYQRVALLLLIVAVASVSFACFRAGVVDQTIINDTDSALCVASNESILRHPECHSPIQPGDREESTLDCDRGDSMTVILALTVPGSTAFGPVIYEETKSCNDWRKHFTLRVQQVDGEFVVTEGEAAEGPSSTE